MTREEAIKIFKEVREEVLAKETELSKQVFENLGIKAIDLAIKALEQQQEPSEDCISRQVVKEMLTETWTKYMPMELDINLSFVLDKISALPSVTPSYNSVKTELRSSDDCISREKAVYVASGYCAPQNIADELRRLPSVKPTRPHGEWIYVQYDGNKNIGNWHCSNCRQICIAMHSMDDAFDFCPNCGADMREGDKE